jgi:hypothetical protein
LSRALAAPIYWAGHLKGYRYQLRVWDKDHVAVRYVARAVRARAAGGVLTVAMYPFPGAYHVLKAQAKGKAVAGPRGSIYYALPTFRPSSRGTHVLIAFPGVDYQIELYDRDPTLAPRIAAAGRVQPVTR